jgi:hypothetical protein
MITKDGYAIVPWAKRFVLLHNNEQLSDHRTTDQATVAMNKHRKNNAPLEPKCATKKTGTLSTTKENHAAKIKTNQKKL